MQRPLNSQTASLPPAVNAPLNRRPHRLSRLLCTLALAALGAASLLPTRAAAAEEAWQLQSIPGSSTAYIKLDDIRAIYKFAPDKLDRRSGTRSLSNGPTTLAFGPEAHTLSIHGVRCRLSHPTHTNERGEFLISRTDAVTLIDPILRPTYIPQRREVKTVVIDPGHGGHDVGQQTPHVREADSMLSLAHQLAAQLRQRGYEVLLTREDNRYLSDQQRIDCANRAENAIFLSLHLNSGRSDYHGIETYTVAPYAPQEDSPAPQDAGSSAPSAPAPATPTDNAAPMPGNEQDAANTALAYALQASLIRSSGAQDGGCRRTCYSLLSSVRCPAAIVELGYATHAEEGAALSTEEYRSILATALANGVDAFAGAIKPGAKPPVTTAPPPPPPTPVKVDRLGKDDDGKAGKKKTSSGKTTRKSKSKSRRRNSGKRTGRKR